MYFRHSKSEDEKTEFEAPEGESRILVVDDEMDILELFTDILGIMGHNVVTARNGSQAIDRLEEGEYDLIICDMKMPGFDGRELYNSIEEKDCEIAKRVIFVTGDTVNPETQKFLKSTGNLYISKPFRVGEVKQVITRGLLESKIIPPSPSSFRYNRCGPQHTHNRACFAVFFSLPSATTDDVERQFPSRCLLPSR